MKILVTGSTGFLGSNLIRLLLEQGHEVVAVRRSKPPGPGLEGLPVIPAIGSLLDQDFLESALDGCHQIYHLAGTYEAGPGAEASMWQTFVDGTRTLGEAALKTGIKRWVVCSSSVSLPFGTLESPASEDDPDPFANGHCPYKGPMLGYYQAKLAQETVARSYLRRGLDGVIVNPDFVIGPWDVKPSSSIIVLQVAKAPWIPFYPPGGKNFIGSKACARGMVQAMARGRSGQRYLLGDHNLPFGKALSLIAEVVGRPAPRYALPRAALNVTRLMEGPLADRAPSVQNLATRMDSLFIGRYRSPARARAELGLQSEPLEPYIEAAWNWFRERGYL